MTKMSRTPPCRIVGKMNVREVHVGTCEVDFKIVLLTVVNFVDKT